MKFNASKTNTMIVSRARTMHPQSPPLTIGGIVLKESDDLIILGVTFDSKMTIEKYLRLVSRTASQRLGILRKSWRVFHDRSLLERCFVVLCCQFWSSVLQCGARQPIHTINYWTVPVSGARFLTGGVFECNIAHRRSVTFLCMLYKIRCNPMHSLNDALPGSYVPVRVTSGALFAHAWV